MISSFTASFTAGRRPAPAPAPAPPWAPDDVNVVAWVDPSDTSSYSTSGSSVTSVTDKSGTYSNFTTGNGG